MTLSLRPTKLLLPLLLAYASEQLLWEFALPSSDDPALRLLELALLALGLGGSVLYWRRLEPLVRTFLLLNVAYLLALMLESYATHGTWLVYMHVFSKVLLVFVLFGTYGYYRRYGLPPLRTLAVLLLAVFGLNLLVVHPEALSLHSFLSHERGVTGSSALVLVLPTLLCLNWYLGSGRRLPLLLCLAGLGLIVFVQHRSVWLTTLTALPLNLLLLWRRGGAFRFRAGRVALLLGLPLVLGSVGGLATVLGNPEVMKKFEHNYEDIAHADKQGTGNWRILQMEAYRPLVAERPLLGWRLEGFELPMQFYDPSSDEPMWPDGTGHHFHSFYLDRLFYFGWLGLLLLLTLPFMQFIKRVANPTPLPVECIAVLSSMAACLVFGLSYDWPLYLFALMGLALAAASQPPAVASPPPRPVPAAARELVA